MTKFTKELVDSYADKLLIGLTEDENKMVLEEFEIIDNNMELISKFPNIQEVTPMTHCLDDFKYSPREDVIHPSVPTEYLLSNCDEVEDTSVVVPRVV